MKCCEVCGAQKAVHPPTTESSAKALAATDGLLAQGPDRLLPSASSDTRSGPVQASATSRTALPGEDRSAKDLFFAPVFPQDGALLSGSEGAPDFTWRPGGFERFHVEFSASPDFSRHPVRETAGFRSPTRYTPGERVWSRVQELGRSGQPVYWRVVAKIPGALGVVVSDRVSWFAFEPPAVRIEMAQSRPSIETDSSRGSSPVTADMMESSQGCICSEARDLVFEEGAELLCPAARSTPGSAGEMVGIQQANEGWAFLRIPSPAPQR